MRSYGRQLVLALSFVLAALTACDTPDLAQYTKIPSDVALGAPLQVQVRWGGGNPGLTPQRWDGQLHLDCGRVTAVRFLGLEIADGDGVAPHKRGEDGTHVHWRSLAGSDFDGVEATILPCRDDDVEAGSTLTVTTPNRQWTARLAWSRDDFVSLPVGKRGQRLDVRIRPLPGVGDGGERALPHGGSPETQGRAATPPETKAKKTSGAPMS